MLGYSRNRPYVVGIEAKKNIALCVVVIIGSWY